MNVILTTSVDLDWSYIDSDYYISRGYIKQESHQCLSVKVEDLLSNSSVEVDVLCTFCHQIYRRPFNSIFTSIQKSIISKWSCNGCYSLKKAEELKEKNRQGLLAYGDDGFFNFTKNRQNYLLTYIDKYGTVDYIGKREPVLYEKILKYDGSLEKIISQLGMSYAELTSKVSPHYYNDFKKVENRINEFILEYKRFPMYKELTTHLKISARYLRYHGGIEKIKEKMSYQDTGDLIDDRGFQNKSRIEFIVAQYLIANNIHYKREIYPFSDSQHRTDFLLITEDGEKYFIEVWGFSKQDSTPRGIEYNIGRKEKEKKYSDFQLNLISIEYDCIERVSYMKIQEYLKEKLSFLKTLKLNIFEDITYMQPKTMSDIDILDKLMEISPDQETLPTQTAIKQAGLLNYYNEVLRRYDSMFDFGAMYNKKLKIEFWTREKLFMKMDEMVHRGLSLSRNNFKKEGFLSIVSFLTKEFGTSKELNIKLAYFDEWWSSSVISEYDINHISKVSKMKEPTKRIGSQEIDMAKKIIQKIEGKLTSQK